MPIVTVHSFAIYNIMHDAYLPCRGKATEEKIKSLGGKIIPHTAEEVDESVLTETGRYHEPETPIQDK